jgi:hypothetical protein
MLLAICGYEDAGKSTITDMLCGADNTNSNYACINSDHIDLFINPKEYVTNELECKEEIIYQLMRKFVDSNWEWDWCKEKISVAKGKSQYTNEKKWKSVSFADPLKKVCSILLDYPYLILLGLGKEERKQREILKTACYNICGSLTGRQLLEYMGTDVFRNHLDDNIWIKLMSNKCKNYLNSGHSVVISDLRFSNEKDMLLSMGGKLMLVYRNIKELEPIDRNLHPSKWLYQTFINDASYTIENIGTLDELCKKISFLLL